MQPITLYGHHSAPNPWKVITILEELGLPYDMKLVEFGDVKKPDYVKVNPNGRLPAIEDPNTGITLWESGAIILYLIDQYDTTGKISYSKGPEKYQQEQWLMFQVSGQGPYFGQAAWFARFHPEKIQSAIDRYVNEIVRVTAVLDSALKDRQWLVGDKCTYADLCFVTWANIGFGIMKQLGKDSAYDQFPNYKRWLEALQSREVVKGVADKVAKGRAAQGLPP